MSYINNKNNELFIKSKVTQKGREKISKGKFNFTTWAIGDSEINYSSSGNTNKVINISDNYPTIKYFLYNGNNVINNITEDNISVDKIALYDQKEELGYFSTSGLTTKTTSPYVLSTGVANKSILDGDTTLAISSGNANIGDIVLIKLVSSASNSETTAINLWYKLVNTGSSITVDRNLPNLSLEAGNFSYIFYKNDEIINIFGEQSVDFSWNNNLIEFVPDNEQLILSGSPVWNMNIVYNENPCGFNSGWTGFSGFTSQNYLGTKDPYLDPFNLPSNNSSDIVSINCGVVKSVSDINKNAAIIHYTNNDYYNGYGEFIYVDDDNKLEMIIPNILYHNRYFTSSTISGMKFVSDDTIKTISGTSIEYYDIIEYSGYIKPNAVPRVIGKLFYGLNTILITDDEIITAISFKGNRNYTLPELEAELEDSNNGLLEPGQTIYLTYELKNSTSTGFKTGLPCQNYTKVYNNTTKNKNINFWIKENNPFSYLVSNNSGTGFHGNQFNLIYQIVDNYGDRPVYNQWKQFNFINEASFISASQLNTGYFTLTNSNISSSTSFTLGSDFSNNSLNYGEEKMFYGNIKAFAGATVFKTNLIFTLDNAKFNNSTNPTFKSGDSTKMTELNVYDSDGDLMIIGKLSKPLEIGELSNVTIKVDIDF